MKEMLLEAWNTHNGFLINLGLKAVLAFIVIIAGKVCVKITEKILSRAAVNIPALDGTLVSIVRPVMRYGIIVIAVLIILDAFGINTTSLIALLGAAGVAVGLALKDTLSNIASGIILILLRSYRKGDYIEFGSYSGTVKDMDLFVTVLETPDGIYISAPNSSIWGMPLKNYTRNGKRRMDLSVSIAYSDSIDTAFEVMREIIAGEPRFLPEPEPQIMVQSLGDSGVTIMLRAWASGSVYWDIYWKQMRNIKEKIEAAGLTIPFPQRDLHIVPLSGGQGNASPAPEDTKTPAAGDH
jgi:small conductance mechanosensitive channel